MEKIIEFAGKCHGRRQSMVDCWKNAGRRSGGFLDMDCTTGRSLFSTISIQIDSRIGGRESGFHVRLVWVAVAPSNVCAFAWKLLLDRLPTRVNLLRRKIFPNSPDACCPLCQEAPESVDHLFVLCPFAARVWALCYCWYGLHTTLP